VRPRGQATFGTKTEVKNLNSFRFLRQALDYEIARQVAVLEQGGRIEQETRLYDVDSATTVGMRAKEHAHDYRYFPEPDLLPLAVSEAWSERLRSRMPELPAAKRVRFRREFGLRDYDVEVLTGSRALAEFFERTAAACGDPVEAAKWVQGELLGALKAAGKELGESPVTPEALGELVAMVRRGELSGKMAKEVFVRMFAVGESARAIVEREGLRQISDTGELERIVDEVLASHPRQLEQYRAGKTTVLGFFVGQVMRATRGQANPQAVQELLRKKLAEPGE
jgi:aspartyl-tRNA(Asn)/glutamyl-tRNA(Gln) amidotransferase subunit B